MGSPLPGRSRNFPVVDIDGPLEGDVVLQVAVDRLRGQPDRGSDPVVVVDTRARGVRPGPRATGRRVPGIVPVGHPIEMLLKNGAHLDEVPGSPSHSKTFSHQIFYNLDFLPVDQLFRH